MNLQVDLRQASPSITVSLPQIQALFPISALKYGGNASLSLILVIRITERMNAKPSKLNKNVYLNKHVTYVY